MKKDISSTAYILHIALFQMKTGCPQFNRWSSREWTLKRVDQKLLENQLKIFQGPGHA